MQVTVSSSNIKIGEVTCPLNSIYFKSDGNIVTVYKIGSSTYIVSDSYDKYTNSAGEQYDSVDDLIVDLKTALVEP